MYADIRYDLTRNLEQIAQYVSVRILLRSTYRQKMDPKTLEHLLRFRCENPVFFDTRSI